MNTSVFGQIDPAYDEPRVQPDELGEDAIELEPGTSIQGKYTVLGVLGHGGFAVVYDAKHDGLGRGVAIKVLHLRHDTPLALVERFRREGRISALVRHPNVLEVYDTGALADGSPYLVMERVNGENLSALIRRAPLPIATAVEVTRQLLSGLVAIEERGIVHRDVKPDNLMLHDAGDGVPTVKLVDFGISKRVGIEPQARLTCHGALVGTPQYMSPEQIRGEDVDIRTDIYATGAVLYESLTGHAPHESASFSELVVSVLNGQVVPVRARRANCPLDLERIILTALSPKRAQRYASPRDLLEALDAFAEAFALPRGPDAFGAPDSSLDLTPVRSSFVSVRRLGIKLGRPAQLALLALLLSTPGQVGHVHGATAPGSVAVGSTRATIGAPGGAAVDALVRRVTTHAPRAEQPVAPSSRVLLSPTPPELLTSAAPEVLKAEHADSDLALAEPRGADAPLASALDARPEHSEPARERKRRTKTSEPGTPVQVAPQNVPPPEPSAQPSSTAPELGAQPGTLPPATRLPPATLDPAPRQQLDDTLQSALAALVRGRLDVAKARYSEAVKLAPREPAAYRGLGLVASRLGAKQEARAALTKYLALAPHAPDAATIRERLSGLR